jgi:hypothetical protein
MRQEDKLEFSLKTNTTRIPRWELLAMIRALEPGFQVPVQQRLV